MNERYMLLLLTVFLVACAPSRTSATTATAPQPPASAEGQLTPTPELSNTPPVTDQPSAPGEPVVVDFGGKAIYTQIYFDDLETGDLPPGWSPGKEGEVTLTNDPAEVVDGEYSLRFDGPAMLSSDPDVLPLEGNTTYLVQFDYRILARNQDEHVLTSFFFRPTEHLDDFSYWVSTWPMLTNADASGSFTFGALTGDAGHYVASIDTASGAVMVIDNLRVFRQEPSWSDQQPERWASLETLPFPRLGNYALGAVVAMADGMVGERRYYSANQIENRLALFDVIAGWEVANQTMDPGLTFNLRSLNPDILILPYTIAHEHGIRDPEFDNATVDLYQIFQAGLADEWIVRDSQGEFVGDPSYPSIYKMNISAYCPVVDGQTFQDFQVDWMVNAILKSGNWDGIFIDNLFARVNPHIAHSDDPALFEYDYNLNGIADETLAQSSDMTRQAVRVLLDRLRGEVGDSEIILGNIWAFPETVLAPEVNGFVFECVDDGWVSDWPPGFSEPSWRLILEQYFYMQAETIAPTINILQGCGNQDQMEPTADDLRSHRLTLGTALLSDGFVEYDLHDNLSSPYWFDEYAVNQEGAAEEAAENKGYLGLALSEAVELASPATLIWEADFESGAAPAELQIWANSGVSISPHDAISGNYSLVLDNPDHSQWGYIDTNTIASRLTFAPGRTHVVTFDWRIIETLDILAEAFIWNGSNQVPRYAIPGVVTGDSGRAIFPTTLGSGSGYYLTFALSGGGKVAIDNVRITQGGAGPWRRDFENGFVLVNPLNLPYTFTLDQLPGPFGRTNIRRILGAQAPQINNGQPVGDELTLQPFDAIILLADHIPAP